MERPQSSPSSYLYLIKLYFPSHFHVELTEVYFTATSKENTVNFSLDIKFQLQGNSQQENLFVLALKGEIFQTLFCQVETPSAGNTG